MGRLGGSLAPLVTLLDGVWLPLPKLTYGGIALLGACTALLLPETRRAQLPETIQDVERKRCVPMHVAMGAQVPNTLGRTQREDMSTCVYLVHECEGAWVRGLRYVNCMYKSVHESVCVYRSTQDCQEKVGVCPLRYACKSGMCTHVWESLVGAPVFVYQALEKP